MRKTTGSYYTPTSLIECLLDTALDPVLDAAEKHGTETGDVDAEVLGITVCDPACGSGHFLVAAARRIAKRLAAARTGDPEPPPEQVRTALREVIGRCIYGVDVNPLAAELAKVSLWLEAMEPGKPLAFLDAQIKVGNALIGATPALLDSGLPQEAFKPIEGDDKKIAAARAKQNKAETEQGKRTLFDVNVEPSSNTRLAVDFQHLVGPRMSLADTHVQQQRFRAYADSPGYRSQKLLADTWCAAFVWPKVAGEEPAPTLSTLEQVAEGAASATLTAAVEKVTTEHRFFHWHLEFPHIFRTERPEAGGSRNEVTGWYGSFTVVVGNPPWDRVKLQEQEFFASQDVDIAQAPNAAARKRLIAKLPETNPALYDEFQAAKRRAEGESHILRNSGRYPLTGRGDINTYAVFAELDRHLLGPTGRLGVILPLGIATDATTQFFFQDLVRTSQLASVYSFAEIRRVFVGTDDRKPFCLLTLSQQDEPEAWFAFSLASIDDLARPGVRYTLSPEEITLLNPNTGTCPVFRSRRDAEITLGIYRRVPVLINENDAENGNPWGIRFMTMFHMSNDSHLFHTREELEAEGWTLNGNVFEREISGGGGDR